MRRRKCVDHVIEALGVSERKACRALGQPRSSQRYQAVAASAEEALTADIIGWGANTVVTVTAGSRPCSDAWAGR